MREMRAKFVRNKSVKRKVREEGEREGGPDTGGGMHSPVVHGEGSGEAGWSPEARGGHHGRERKSVRRKESQALLF